MSEFETRAADWLSFHEALDRILSAASPVGIDPDPVHLVSARPDPGPALAQEIRAPATLPPGPTSAMDGYALRREDLDHASPSLADVPVAGVSRPGAPFAGALDTGHAVRIMTGALLPRRADTVIPVEDTDGERTREGRVRIEGLPPAGRYVRPAGQEMAEGDLLAPAGASLCPFLTALLVSSGVEEVRAFSRPRVGLLVTGSELVGPGSVSEVRKGTVRADVLSPTLPPLIRAAGGVCPSPVRAPDDRHELREALERASRDSDLILTTGGASMGEEDLLKRVLDEMDHEPDFWRARIRPGSPLSLGRLQGTPVVGLPGNPVSALTTFLVLVRPAIRKMGGHGELFLPEIRARAAEGLSGREDLTLFLRVRLSPRRGGGWDTFLTGAQGSGVTASIARARGLAVIPEGVHRIEAGQEVRVVLLPSHGWERADPGAPPG